MWRKKSSNAIRTAVFDCSFTKPRVTNGICTHIARFTIPLRLIQRRTFRQFSRYQDFHIITQQLSLCVKIVTSLPQTSTSLLIWNTIISHYCVSPASIFSKHYDQPAQVRLGYSRWRWIRLGELWIASQPHRLSPSLMSLTSFHVAVTATKKNRGIRHKLG